MTAGALTLVTAAVGVPTGGASDIVGSSHLIVQKAVTAPKAAPVESTEWDPQRSSSGGVYASKLEAARNLALSHVRGRKQRRKGDHGRGHTKGLLQNLPAE